MVRGAGLTKDNTAIGGTGCESVAIGAPREGAHVVLLIGETEQFLQSVRIEELHRAFEVRGGEAGA